MSDLDEKTIKSVKNLSWVTTSTAATSNVSMISQNISLNISKISNDSNHQIVESENINDYCYYQKS